MEPTTARSEEKKSSRLSQAATSLGGGSKASLSCSEEFLTWLSAELTNEAFLIAGYPVNNVPTKEKQTQDQGTQLSKHDCECPTPTSQYPLLTAGQDTALSSLATSPGYGDSNFYDGGLYLQCSSPTPEELTPALTETVPAPRHTSCHPLVTRHTSCHPLVTRELYPAA